MNEQGSNLKIRKSALGKGYAVLANMEEEESDPIDSYLNKKIIQPNTNTNVVVEINVNQIIPNPHQPRKIFDDDKLQSLAISIKNDGIIQPIIVSQSDEKNKYILIAGERRWRAAKLAGFTKIPAIIKEVSSESSLVLALIENIQRQDLNIIEEAEAYAALIKDFGLTQEQCAQKVGKDRSTITNTLRLLSLPKVIKDDLMEGRLTMGHGRVLLSLENIDIMLKARDLIISKNLSVRKTEQLCKMLIKNPEFLNNKDSSHEISADLEYIAEMLRNKFKTKIKVLGTENKGKIEIHYFSGSELERILNIIDIQI